eukprot:XP_028352192.1 uncharacterized protein LOC114487239 isoform X1 [Physeter catodon]
MSYRACLYGCPVPTSPRLCLAPGLMAGLGAATWPVASLLAPLLLHLLLSLPSLRATSLHRKPGCRSARPRHPDGDSRLKNWMEEAEELPWTGAPAGRSPGISCPPGASRLPPGLGCSRLKSSVGQDRGHATPVPSSSKITSSRHWLPRVSLSSYVNHSPHQPAIVTIAMHNSSLFLMLQIMPQLMA